MAGQTLGSACRNPLAQGRTVRPSSMFKVLSLVRTYVQTPQLRKHMSVVHHVTSAGEHWQHRGERMQLHEGQSSAAPNHAL